MKCILEYLAALMQSSTHPFVCVFVLDCKATISVEGG